MCGVSCPGTMKVELWSAGYNLITNTSLFTIAIIVIEDLQYFGRSRLLQATIFCYILES
jgi:hypothetical protein